MVGQAAALVALAVLDGRTALLVTSVAFGLTVGNLLMLHPLLLAERFGVLDYGRIYSRSQLVATLGVAVGPLFIGALHDVVDGYGIAFAVAGAASLLAAGVLCTSGPTAVRPPAARGLGPGAGPRRGGRLTAQRRWASATARHLLARGRACRRPRQPARCEAQLVMSRVVKRA
jgi:MFS family permease